MSSFHVTLYNLNYNVSAEKVAIGEKNVAVTPDYIAIEVAIEGMNASRGTNEADLSFNALCVFRYFQKYKLFISVSDQDNDRDVTKKILDFCSIERSKREICEYMEFRNLTYFTRTYLNPFLESKKLKMTIPDKPSSRNQKYVCSNGRED